MSGLAVCTRKTSLAWTVSARLHDALPIEPGVPASPATGRFLIQLCARLFHHALPHGQVLAVAGCKGFGCACCHGKAHA